MRGPSPSFKAELAAYQRQVVPEIADDDQRQLATKIIGDWKDHASVEKTWNTIKQKLPAEVMPTAAEFINLVVERRLSWEQVSKKVIQQGPQVEAGTRRAANYLWESGDYDNAKDKMSGADRFHQMRDQLLGRKKALAPRKLFTKDWSDKFRELCGDPLDEVVRVLTEVAFEQPRTIGAVRGVQRPTTRRARQPKATS
jgi:hypothetical protein